MKYEISEELRQEIANYLSLQPYREVCVLISKISQLKKIEEDAEDQHSQTEL